MKPVRNFGTFRGKTVGQWAKQLGTSRGLIYRRLRNGESWEDILNPLIKTRQMSLFSKAPKRQKMAKLARVVGISPNLLSWRLKRGWSWEKALFTPVDQKLSAMGKTGGQANKISKADQAIKEHYEWLSSRKNIYQVRRKQVVINPGDEILCSGFQDHKEVEIQGGIPITNIGWLDREAMLEDLDLLEHGYCDPMFIETHRVFRQHY